jgi:hypothetical protein
MALSGNKEVLRDKTMFRFIIIKNNCESNESFIGISTHETSRIHRSLFWNHYTRTVHYTFPFVYSDSGQLFL